MERPFPLGWPGLIGKCRSMLQQSVAVGQTGRTVKMESARSVQRCIQIEMYMYGVDIFLVQIFETSVIFIFLCFKL